MSYDSLGGRIRRPFCLLPPQGSVGMVKWFRIWMDPFVQRNEGWERGQVRTLESSNNSKPRSREKPAKEIEQAASRVAIQSRQRKVSEVKGKESFQKDEILEMITSILRRLGNWHWSHGGFSVSISEQGGGGKKPNAPDWEVNWPWGNTGSE